MADIDIADVAQTLARVQLNYSYLAQAWYDIFYNPTPMEVEVQFYDDAGNAQLYKIPNRATDRALFTNGEGSPEDVQAGAVGTIYQDTLTGGAYIKTSGEPASTTGWTQIITQNDLNKIILRGSQSPEGVVLAPPGVLYVNTDEQYGTLYMKRTTTGRTGWERIDSYPTSFVRESFNVQDGAPNVKLNGICDNATLLSIYIDGTLMNPTKYRLWGDQQTVEFLEPLKTTDTRESIEVIAQYYMDIHLDQGIIAEELRELAQEATNAANVCETVSTEVIEASNNLQIKIDTAVEVATTEAVENIKEAYAEEADRLEEITNTIENSITNMYNTVRTEYKDIQDWYTKTNENRVQCSEIQRDVTNIQANIRVTAELFNEQYGENNIMLKAEYEPELDRLDAKINSEDEKVKAELKADIARVDNTILSKEEVINNELQRLDVALTTSESELRGLIATYEETNEAWHMEQDSRVDNIELNFYNDDNMPIDKNGLYRNNKYINTDIKSTVTDTNITVNLRPDCSYYTVDLGEVMTGQNSDCIFEFGVTLGNTISTEFGNLDTTMENTNTDLPTEVLYQARIMFKNESIFTPFIEWDDTKIIWLGEEPELEATKNYLVELISYDNGVVWYAHVLGICQPAIRIDTFSTTMNIVCTGAPAGTVPVDLYYDLDGTTNIYDGTYNLVNGVLTLPKEVERRYRNTEIANIRLHASTDNVFIKHVCEQVETLEPDGEYTFNLNWANTKKEQYSYALTVTSGETENYMKADVQVQNVSLATFKGYVNAGRVKFIQIEDGGRLAEYTYVGLENWTEVWEDDEGDTQQTVHQDYYMNLKDDAGIPVKKVTTAVLGASTTVIVLRSPYYQELPNGSVFYQMSVDVRLWFSQGQTYTEAQIATKNPVYILYEDVANNRGCTISFDNINDTIMDIGTVNEPEGFVDNYVIKAQLHHIGQVEVERETDYIIPCYESVEGVRVNVALNGMANIAVPNEAVWTITRTKDLETTD